MSQCCKAVLSPERPQEFTVDEIKAKHCPSLKVVDQLLDQYERVEGREMQSVAIIYVSQKQSDQLPLWILH